MGVLHLTVVESSHCRIAKTSDFKDLLKSRLGSSLQPNPAPLVFLVFLAQFFKSSQIIVTALGLTVEDMRKESKDTKLLFFASL